MLSVARIGRAHLKALIDSEAMGNFIEVRLAQAYQLAMLVSLASQPIRWGP